MNDTKVAVAGEAATAAASWDSSAVSRRVGELRRAAENVVTAHPYASLGTSIVAGIVLGWWVKRK
ncbi:MAG: hypothetical protein R3C10_13745 [Pirellulales bacterium]